MFTPGPRQAARHILQAKYVRFSQQFWDAQSRVNLNGVSIFGCQAARIRACDALQDVLQARSFPIDELQVFFFLRSSLELSDTKVYDP